ncbi:MAG: N-formylglutamate amidohydrolase [Alphaproteobacteria bacterium]
MDETVSGIAPGAASLIGDDDPPPFELGNPEGNAQLLLLCDHASPAVPGVMGGLGLDEAVLGGHIGWDIGAGDVTRELGRLLDAPAVLSGYSRLVIDCNRRLGGPQSILAVSDGVPVPGNQAVGAAEAAARAEAFFRPYHDAVAQRIDAFLARGVVPAVVAVHSFTPVMKGVERPWHLGVLWDRDPRLARPLLAELRRDPTISVGDNQPYSAGEPEGYSMKVHGTGRGLPHVQIEVRQDLIDTRQGAVAWARRLAPVLGRVLAERSIYRVEHD